MKKKELSLQAIYLNQMIEVRDRLIITQSFIESYFTTGSVIEFDSAILQFRKALEATAYASISPNKIKYKSFRQKEKKSGDFTKDFKATAIFRYLEQINKDFYPTPILPPNKVSNRNWHYALKENDFLTKKAFSSIYDRLGKFLHADNPWDNNNKHRENMATDIKETIPKLFNLLELHATFIKEKNYSKVWIIKVPQNKLFAPEIIEAIASGDFFRE